MQNHVKCVCACVCANCCMRKRACHTITNYLNENHRQVRRFITERACTYISESAVQNRTCKKTYFSAPPPIIHHPPPPSTPPRQLNGRRSLLSHPSESTCQIEYNSQLLPAVCNAHRQTRVNTRCSVCAGVCTGKRLLSACEFVCSCIAVCSALLAFKIDACLP